MKLGLRQANQQFSKAIKAVRAGREVTLTDRWRPIAVIKPIAEEGALEAALSQMADDGLVTLPLRRGPLPAPRWKPSKAKGGSLSRTIVDLRDDRL
jgi:prevent-host-death family protein